jgi:hypothetical protein
MTRCCAIVVFALLAGCAPIQWAKSGATPEQVSQDRKRCEYEARTALAGSQMPVERAMFREAELERLCMESKGYTRGR